MILFILIGFFTASIRHYDVREALRETSLIPLWICEIVFWIFQICAWRGIYIFIPYGVWLERLLMLTLLWPVLKFELYAHAIGGAALVLAGTVLNRICVTANSGAMPVYSTLSRWTGYCTEASIAASGDAGHIWMTAQTKLNVLGDWIDVGFSIMSIGDILMHLFVTLIVFGTIRALVMRKRSDGNA